MWVIKTDLSGDWNYVSLPDVLVFVCSCGCVKGVFASSPFILSFQLLTELK